MEKPRYILKRFGTKLLEYHDTTSFELAQGKFSSMIRDIIFNNNEECVSFDYNLKGEIINIGKFEHKSMDYNTIKMG
jgi:hypothetical protein